MEEKNISKEQLAEKLGRSKGFDKVHIPQYF